MQTRQLIEGITTPRLDSSMILLHGFGHRVGCAVQRRLELGKEIAHRISQIRLVVPERQDVIGTTVADGLGDVGLGTHGIERDDAPFQRQGSQEFRNGRLFIGLHRRCPLPEHQTGTCGKRAHQMQRRSIQLACAPTTFTVDCHHGIGPQRWQDRSDPAPKGGLELYWINYSTSRN